MESRGAVVERIRAVGGEMCNSKQVPFEEGKKRRSGAEGGEHDDLHRKVQKALEGVDDEGLGMSGKISLTMEVLRARRLELELEKSRRSIEAIVNRRKGSESMTIKAAVAANAVKDLPVGSFIEIKRGMFSLESAGNDTDAMLMTLVIDEFSKN